MISFLRKIFKPKYQTLNLIKIKANNIISNFNYLKKLQPQAEIFPVLKSNAYGHGLKEMCQILNKTSTPMVVVDSFPEAQIVYRYFKGSVLILGEMPLKAYKYCKFKRTEFVIYNEETLRHLSKFGKKAKVHLFYNSGMNREGIKDIVGFLERSKKYLNRVEVSGFCSHMASASIESELNDLQVQNFSMALDSVRSAGYSPHWIHIGNSASSFIMKNNIFNAFRPGLSLYGHDPFSERNKNLKPALSLYSKVVSIQELQAGESVSYDEEYRVVQASRVAVIPFGYFEGLNLNISNQAQFLVGQKEPFWALIAGRVCMNLTCLDVNNHEVSIGDQVEVISRQQGEDNSAEHLAELSKQSIYEFLVKIQGSIRREIDWR